MSKRFGPPPYFECYSCHYVGPREVFGQITKDSNHRCPECKDDGAVFPYWRLRCIRCGGVYEVDWIFGRDMPLDTNPQEYLQTRAVLREIDGCPTEYSWQKFCGNKLFLLLVTPPVHP